MLEQLFYLVRTAEKILRVEGMDLRLSPLFFRTVAMILKNPEVTADFISKAIVADKALVARTLTELEERGLIDRRRNPLDKRSFLLVPTDKLLAVKEQILRIEKDTEAKIREIAASEGIKLW
ncbi:MAG: MarR family transcriptional regulator [Selenomonadaceae bacterium]|nr:MarR family transcriptional regulator [Selenomonadaceae bacterium]